MMGCWALGEERVERRVPEDSRWLVQSTIRMLQTGSSERAS
eukprot:CAMPEP_0118964630 /NCGR_PEP_ID=MMETSP1173-20130426/2291_1 /TAXON_ID=1034831 /ORGANISM="Rhizochromulina marina cf, Strain CCMP1243" /LENGTH=40 /DNA_ID= /DNA_START= /DNA_END= /DNA_ORIENTATION=